MTNLEKCAFNFKSLLDAIRIRNHVIEMFERADLEPDRAQRSSLLTFGSREVDSQGWSLLVP
jgi:NADH:ubiquinone reductase (H+-translocating)